MFCGGTWVVNVRVICYSRKNTDFAFWAKLCPGWRIMTIIMTGKLRGEKIV